MRANGFESEIFTLHYHPRYASQVRNYLEYDRFSDPGNTVIYHFSIGSPVTKKFLRLADRKVIIYHNITPYHFFLDFHRILAKDCFKGRIELKSLADKVDLALGDSEFNRGELLAAGFPRTGVLPLVMDFAKFDLPVLPVFKEIFADGKSNILFVGRVIPNKKIEDVIKTFHVYQKHFNPASRLFIVGEYRGFERYFSALQDLIARLQVQDIHFSGHVPLAEMVSYAKLSHLYLHLSEHEGFCAPIVESFHLGIPVVAYDAGAVGRDHERRGRAGARKELFQDRRPVPRDPDPPGIAGRAAGRAAAGPGKIPPAAHRRHPARLPARRCSHDQPGHHRPLRRDQPQGPQPQPVRAKAEERPGLVFEKAGARLCQDHRERGRIYIRGIDDLPDLEKILGVYSYSPAFEMARDYDALKEEVARFFPAIRQQQKFPGQLPAHRQGLFSRFHGRGEGDRHHPQRADRHAGPAERPGLRTAHRDRPPPPVPVQRKDPRASAASRWAAPASWSP